MVIYLPQLSRQTKSPTSIVTGAELRKKALNRIGNLLIPNSNYCLFENWAMPILDAMLEEQKATAASKVEKLMLKEFSFFVTHKQS
jgi:deoxyhypusine synthase